MNSPREPADRAYTAAEAEQADAAIRLSVKLMKDIDAGYKSGDDKARRQASRQLGDLARNQLEWHRQRGTT